MVIAQDVDDPMAEADMAACDLLSAGLGVRHCGAVTIEARQVVGMSTAFARLPESLRSEAVAAAVDALGGVVDAASDPDCPIEFAVPAGLGRRGFAFQSIDQDVAVFAIEEDDAGFSPDRFTQLAACALALVGSSSETRSRQRQLASAERMLGHIEGIARIGSWELLVGTNRLVWSNEIYAIHDLEPDGNMTAERILPLYPSPAREKILLEIDRAASVGNGFELTAPMKTASGKSRIVRIIGRTEDGWDGRRLYGTMQDVTLQVAAERRLWWAANHDPLTGLPNRLLFGDRLGVAMRAARREGRSFALILIEIADIARLTGPTGFATSDKHMLSVASRLRAVVRESDTFCRISMSEFGLIVADVCDEIELDPPMRRLRAQFAKLQKEESGGDGMVMSVGVAFFPEHGSAQDELVRAAETALVEARRKLDNPVIIFNHRITDGPTRRRATILARARESLEKNEFLPYYQPQFDLTTGEVVGVEALVRWQTPTLTLDAKDFSYALEDHEIGSRVGRVMLDAVIADLAELRRIARRPFRVSINASRSEVLRNDFLETFLEKAHQGNLKPTDFIIEITEDVIIGIDDRTLHDKISYLVSSGVDFSLDDFGTGYASLIHITSFPIKEIKIDKLFTFGIETDNRKRAIVRGIMQIAQSIGLDVIAEGVETVAQQDVLRQIGCRYGQGYLFSYPVPFARFAAMLTEKD